MPIILAIEPDRRQRDALAAVVRQRVGAELILADTTERALEAIGNRVPDLVLVPALLSPQDDAALAAALRVIAAAAHVRTLTIPVLAAHTEAAPSSGLLSRWRRGRSASPAPDGCDPAVFAEQIASYLKESAAERALMVDDVEDDVQGDEPQYAQEFGRDDVRADTNAYVQADAQAYVRTDPQAYQPDVLHYDQPDVQTHTQHDAYAQPDVQAYSQSDVVYAEPDGQADTQPDVAYAHNDVASTQPDVAYAQADVEVYVQPDVANAQPDAQPYVQTDVETYSEPDLRYSQLEMQPYSQPGVQAYAQPDGQEHVQADVREEVYGVVEGVDYDTETAGSDGLSTLILDQEEDIDLSYELDGLETEGFDGTRSETELFDGEPVGVYTMPSVIDDEPDVDAAVFAARKAFAEVEAAVEPVSAAEAIAQSEFEADAVDQEFFAESFADPVYGAEPPRTEPVFEADAAIARAFDDDAVAGAPLVDDINPMDAEPEPAEAEPWISAFLSPRWTWPVMEGVPTEAPAAFVAVVPVEAAVAEARPAPAPHKRDRPEWSELVASLRKDIERRRVEPPQEKPKPSVQVQAPRRSKSKPVQDEWGFFDPEQCGFAALLAKLDEITEGAEDTPVHQPSVHQSS